MLFHRSFVPFTQAMISVSIVEGLTTGLPRRHVLPDRSRSRSAGSDPGLKPTVTFQ
jgi:hypothetical protein